MNYERKVWKPCRTVLALALLLITGLMVGPDAFSEKASSPATVIKKKSPMIQIRQKERPVPVTGEKIPLTLTGRIDRIGKEDIVINDTWFRLSDGISLDGFKVGNRVTFIATDDYELLEIRHARSKTDLPKE